MSESEHELDSPVSQFSFEDEEIVWKQGSIDSLDDTDFIVLPHPLPDAHSLPSTLSDLSGHLGSDTDLSSTLDKLSLCGNPSSVGSAESNGDPHTDDLKMAKRPRKRTKPQSSTDASDSSEYHSGTSTPTASYDDASAFISSFLSSPIKEKNAELDLLRALIIELGVRPPDTSDLPCTLTSARKMLKAEVHINIKDYVATRHKGQIALRGVLKPSKSALRKDIRQGKGASLKWVKKQGLQVLLVTCFA